MSANDDFEAFAKRFYKKYGFLPCGKDDPCRPSAERILSHLGKTFGELERAESAAQATNTGSLQLPPKPCLGCEKHDFCSMSGVQVYSYVCKANYTPRQQQASA